MPATEATSERRASAWAGPAGLALGVLALRLVYLAWLCPFDLVEDEAQYWDWSRHLDWGYYTKGPGIAWLIALSCRLLGGASEFAVRAPAAVCGAIAMWAAARLALEASGSRRVALFAGLSLLAAPVFQATSLLGTIDAPYCACWTLAAWAGWRAIVRGGTWSWPGLGLALGAGVLFKYTMLLLVPGLLWAWWLTRRGPERSSPASARRRFAPLWPAAGLAVFAVSVAPIVIWNARHGWGALRHLLGRVGVSEAGPSLGDAVASKVWTWSPWWTLEYAGAQLGLVGPLLALALVGGVRAVAAVRAARHSGRALSEAASGRAYLAACGLPIVLFYLGVSLLRAPEGNWPMGGYTTLLPLAAWLAADGLAKRALRMRGWLALPAERRPRAGLIGRKPETLGQVLWHWAAGYGLGAATMILIASAAGATGRLQAVLPRLTQGRTLAAHVQELRESMAPGDVAGVMVIAADYGAAAHLAFYLPDRPATLCASSALGGRPTNHDFWADTDLRDPARARRSAVLVGGAAGQWGPWFERLEDAGLARGVERKGLRVWRGWGYRGPPAIPDSVEEQK